MNQIKHDLQFTVELITPDYAKELLADNDHNRKVSGANVTTIAQALTNKEWKVSGQTIVISKNGTLMDGQHRLLAVMQTGISMEHCIVRGVEDEVFKVIDIGKNRSGADVLSIAHIDRSSKIAKVIKMHKAYENRHMTRLAKLSNTELLTAYEANNVMYIGMLDEGEELARIALYRIFSDYQLGVMANAFSQYDEGIEYLKLVLAQDLVKPSEQRNIVELVKQVLIRLNKDGSNRETQEQKYFALFEGFKHYQEGTMPKILPTFDTYELRKIPKAIPYL